MRYTCPHMDHLSHVHQRCYPEHIWRRRWTWKDGLARPPVSSVLSVLKRLEDSGLLTLKRVQVSSVEVVEVTTQLPVWAHGPWGTCVGSRRHTKKANIKKRESPGEIEQNAFDAIIELISTKCLGLLPQRLGNRAQNSGSAQSFVSFTPRLIRRIGTHRVCHLKAAHAHEGWRGESKIVFVEKLWPKATLVWSGWVPIQKSDHELMVRPSH